jgi:hypothetical protein
MMVRCNISFSAAVGEFSGGVVGQYLDRLEDGDMRAWVRFRKACEKLAESNARRDAQGEQIANMCARKRDGK